MADEREGPLTARPLERLSGGQERETQTFAAEGHVLSQHYKLLRELGRGGMGVVFEAGDLLLEGRRVAVKVLPPELAGDEAAVLRLKREAGAVAALEHPNVVRLYEYNHDGATQYLVMELLDGENLAVHLARQGKLPLGEVLPLARAVAEALDYAHEKHVIHRDVKPANLMFKGTGARRTVVVTDFGIASQVRDSLTRATGQEASGTLLYIAPEQLRGKKASGASDQYSLAATVYELLSGDAPFTGQGLSQQILEGVAEPVAGVPAHVNAALSKALAKKPEDRFPTCAAFAAALAVEVAVAPPQPAATVPRPPAAITVPAAPAVPLRSPGLRAVLSVLFVAGLAYLAKDYEWRLGGLKVALTGLGHASEPALPQHATRLKALLAGWSLPDPARNTLAVFPLKGDNEGSAARTLVEATLVGSGKFKLVDRVQLEESGFQRGMTDADVDRLLDRLAIKGVDHVVMGEVSFSVLPGAIDSYVLELSLDVKRCAAGGGTSLAYLESVLCTPAEARSFPAAQRVQR